MILNKNNKKEEKTDIVSTIILDINPSIKLNLDKEDTVFDAIALNEEAAEIVEYLNGKDIKTAIETINSRLIEKEFIKDDTIILLNVEVEIFNYYRSLSQLDAEKNMEKSLLILLVY